MLKQRVYTGIVLALAFIGVLLLPPSLRAAALVIPATVGYWEFLGLCKVSAALRNGLSVVMALLQLVVTFQYSMVDMVWVLRILSFAAGLWAVAFLWVLSYPSSAKIWSHQYFKVAQATVLLFAAWLAMCVLSYSESAWIHLLFVVALVAAADIGAYFSGKQFGRHKLAVNVSPGKTWEGFSGGLCLAIVVALVASYYVKSIVFLPVQSFVVMAAVCACFSVIGDLYESMIKRQVDAKDSSNLLPGHGGVLDRIDGLMPAATLYGLAFLQAGM